MEAVILAAGLGSRLVDRSGCKPLTPILGMPLLEIGVRQAARAGAARAVVVTGHEADAVEAALPMIAARAGIEVVARRVADWSLPNGYSVVAGAEGLEEPFLLMMADHVFSGTILPALAGCAGRDTGVILAVDRHIADPRLDPEDATWVRQGEGNRIEAIGKALTSYDAVDCGAFLATPELLQAIAAAIAAGRPGSLSDGMQVLADAGRAQVLDIGDSWWIDVDDVRALAIAEAEIAIALPEFADHFSFDQAVLGKSRA